MRTEDIASIAAFHAETPEQPVNRSVPDNDNDLVAAAVWPDGFDMRRDGLFLSDERISGPFTLVGEARDGESERWGLALEWLDRDGVKHGEIIPRGDLIGDGSEVFRKLADKGLELPVAKGKLASLKMALAGVSVSVRVRTISQAGWYGTAFAMPDRTIGRSNEKLFWTGPRGAACFGEKGSLDGWIGSVADLAGGNSRVVFALSVAFTGPIADLLDIRPAGFHFRGASSTGKSTLMQAAASVWGGEKFVGSWRATTNGLEGSAAAHSGALLALDEISEVDAQQAANAVYAIANGVGKARSGRTGDARPRASWRVPLLSSGEVGLADKIAEDRGRKGRTGLDMRLIDIPVDAGEERGAFEYIHELESPADFANDLRTAALENYGMAGPAFIEAISKDVDRARASIRRMIEECETSISMTVKLNAQDKRVLRQFALVGAAGELARIHLRLGWADGVPLRVAADLFRAWHESNGGTVSGEFSRGLQAVRDAIDRCGAARFEDVEAAFRIINDRLGYRMPIQGIACWAFTVSGWRETVSGVTDPVMLARELQKQGFMLPGDPTIIVRTSEGTKRVYALPVASLGEPMNLALAA